MRPFRFRRFPESGWRLRGSAIGRLAVALGAVLPISGCAMFSANVTGNFTGYWSDVSTIQVVSAVVAGKNIFIPSTLVVTSGQPQTLSVYNGTGKPHGFAIDGLGIEEVLFDAKETEIRLPPLVGGHVYRIHCQLHPPHRSATLVVLVGD